MVQREPWFVAERAERQAALLWTELPGVVVTPTGAARLNASRPVVALDLQIDVSTEKPPPIRFGVEVKGTRTLSRYLMASKRLQPRARIDLLRQARAYEVAVSLMVIDVRSLAAYVGWLTVVTPKGLAPAPDRPLLPATKEVLASMVNDVREWQNQ